MDIGKLFGGIYFGDPTEGDDEGGGGGSSSSSSVDYSAALIYASDNNKTTALAQIQAQQFALQQASIDRQMALAAGLEQALEGLDTKLQIGKLQYVEQMTAEQNRHVEKLAQVHAEYQKVEKSRPDSATDLPAPEFTAVTEVGAHFDLDLFTKPVIKHYTKVG